VPRVRRRLSVLPLCVVATLLVAAPAGGARTANVQFGDYFYRADRVRIDPGDTVAWTNVGEILHTVTSRRGTPERFNSGNKDVGEKFTRTFTKPGTYDYLCTIHPGFMEGVVQVGPDTIKPKVTRARAKVGKRLKVSFGLSERSSVVIRLTKGGKTVKTLRDKNLKRGSRSITTKLPKPGTYGISIQATDPERNRSRPARAKLRVS